MLYSFTIFGQTFTLTDTTFKSGDSLITHQIIINPDNGRFFMSQCRPYIDSVAAFLIKNKNLVVELAMHSDTRGKNEMQLLLTQSQANSIKEYLVIKGVNPNRIISKGYGGTKPIINKNKIKHLSSKMEMEKAYLLNRRTEFIIISTDYKD